MSPHPAAPASALFTYYIHVSIPLSMLLSAMGSVRFPVAFRALLEKTADRGGYVFCCLCFLTAQADKDCSTCGQTGTVGGMAACCRCDTHYHKVGTTIPPRKTNETKKNDTDRGESAYTLTVQKYRIHAVHQQPCCVCSVVARDSDPQYENASILCPRFSFAFIYLSPARALT